MKIGANNRQSHLAAKSEHGSTDNHSILHTQTNKKIKVYHQLLPRNPRRQSENFKFQYFKRTGEPGGLLSMGSHRVGHD